MTKLFNILILAVLILHAPRCKKNDGATPVPLSKVAIPKFTKKSGDPAINVLQPDKFSATFEIAMLFPQDEKPSKFDVVVIKNGDKANVKLLKAGITLYPSTVSITGNDIKSLFGSFAALGDSYDIGADVYMADGKKWDAFPRYGLGYGSGVSNITGSIVSLQYAAICAYDPDVYAGDFEVVSDEWDDYKKGNVITLTKVDAISFSFINTHAIDPKPFIVKVNALDNSLTAAKQIVGSLWDYDDPKYTNPFMLVAEGNVKPCDKTLTLKISYGSNAGSWPGGFNLVLKKKI